MFFPSSTKVNRKPGVDGPAHCPNSGFCSLDFHAAARPEDKFTYLQTHPAAAMVGDGVNDAAALEWGAFDAEPLR
jgi:hypothetical protein